MPTGNTCKPVTAHQVRISKFVQAVGCPGLHVRIHTLYAPHWPHGSKEYTAEVLPAAQLAAAAALLLAFQPKSSLMKTSSTFTTISGTAEQSAGVRGGCKRTRACKLESGVSTKRTSHVSHGVQQPNCLLLERSRAWTYAVASVQLRVSPANCVPQSCQTHITALVAVRCERHSLFSKKRSLLSTASPFANITPACERKACFKLESPA